MSKQLFSLILLALAALGSWWLADLNTVEERVATKRPEHGPDSFSKRVTKTEMDEYGRVKNKLVAAYMAHYDDDGSIELEQPVMTVFEKDSPPWVVKSQSGLVLQDGKEMVLQGKVYIDREGSGRDRAVNVATSNLRVFPDRKYAETNDYVEIISPPDRISGTGMRLHFSKAIKLTLLSKVRGTYAAR